METLDLRQAIINNVQNNNQQQLAAVIHDSVGNDERTLPGLGVLFEMIWQQSNQAMKDQLVGTLHEHLLSKNVANPTPS